FIANRGRGRIASAAFSVLGLGVVVVAAGGVMSSGIEDVGEAGTAADAYIIVGRGFVLMAIGLVLAAIAVQQARPGPQRQGPQQPGYPGAPPAPPPPYRGQPGDGPYHPPR